VTVSDEVRTAVVYLPEGYNALEAIGFEEVISLVPGFRTIFVADRAGPVVSDSGDVVLMAGHGIDDVDSAEVLMVPGGRVAALLSDERTLEWVRRIDSGTRFTTAMCVGRAVLAAAGLLDGVRVAAQPVPLPAHGVIEVPMRLVADGKFVTGANAVSSLDLGLHVAAQYVDTPMARAMQVSLEYDVEVWGPPFPPRGLPEPGPAELAALFGLVSTGPRAEIVQELFALSGQRPPV
jgi:putative intracellular protease/amidase